jgi:hypothetical protein
MRRSKPWFAALAVALALANAMLLVPAGARSTLGAEKSHAPKAPHMPSPPKFHMPSPPKPQHVNPAKPHPGSNAAMPNLTTKAAVSSPHPTERAVVPFHVTHRGFVNHYHNSYRRRMYPHHSGNNAQLQEQLKHLISLKADLDTLAKEGQATQKQKDILQQDLMAVVERGASKPEPDPVKQLSSSLADALTRKTRFPLDTERLVYDLDVVMNGPLATPSEVSFAIGNGHSLLRGVGIGRADLETISSRMKAVALR